MDGEAVQAWFIAALRKVLQNLYDPHELRASPLVQVFDLQGDAAAGLRRLIFDAIQTLQPGGDVPPHAQAWRIYQIVTYRYLEQSSQAVVASNLGLSIRQLRRQERVAESVLADILWNTHNLAARAAQVAADTLGAESFASVTGDEPAQARESELAWLQRSLPSETVHPRAVIDQALRTITPWRASSTWISPPMWRRTAAGRRAGVCCAGPAGLVDRSRPCRCRRPGPDCRGPSG